MISGISPDLPTWQTGAMGEWRTPVIVLAWIPITLGLDQGSTLTQQHLLGVMTWLLLIALLRGESRLVRVQTVVVIGFATLVEYTFSPLLEVYTYRFDNVPAFVPPGHGLVYLAALSMGRSRFFTTHAKGLVSATVLIGGLYAAWGVSPWVERTDVLGLFWYGCLLGFLAWGRSRMLYVGAFIVVTYLELIGTWLGIWTWATHDPTGLVTMGNPPSGAAGGYGWFDLVAISVAPTVVALLSKESKDVVVDEAVRAERIPADHR